MYKIAILASGSGTNAENIIKYFGKSTQIKVELVLSNNNNAFVLKRAAKLNVETMVFNREMFYKTDKVIDFLNKKNIDFVVLAGFLWLIPNNFVSVFKSKIINIHPALLPKYGGKGMYGMYVHNAVIENNEKESGISIHHVNEKYDDGSIIFQTKCEISENDTPELLAQKIHELEYQYFPKVIKKWILESE
ncbi:MAG: phosphoribosylglycinamide formyltransferase [Bacteroidetes bacterium 4572_117]|nr:MAG: phosphoribosylglycinamide formyltransferase [Bacteroidetes bacterium 4572_117]